MPEDRNFEATSTAQPPMHTARRCWILFVSIALGAASGAAAAPPKVDFFFPAGVARGESATVAASGAFSAWPVKTWVDRPGLTVEPGEKKGELQITAAGEAAGVYWVRLYDGEGASSLRPIVVGNLPEVAEVETNDDPLQPQKLEGSCVVNGQLRKRGDVDGYAIELKQGQTLVASLLGNETLGSPMDAVLQICNADGFVLAQNDDARGLDPLLAFPIPRDGVYLVRTFAFPAEPNSSIAFAGADNFVYRLTISADPFADHALPLAVRSEESTEVRLFGWNLSGESVIVPPPGERETASVMADGVAGLLALPATGAKLITAGEDNSPEAPQLVELPAVVSGRIEAPRDADAFRFAAVKGKKISLRVESRSLGFPLDPLLEIRDAEGKTLSEADDQGRSDRDPDVSFTPPADGEYVAVIRDLHHHGGLRYAYRLTIEEEAPDFGLTLAGDSFTVGPGKPLEIPVTIDRQNGFAGEIEIAAENLPEGVTAEAVKSLPKGDTAKTVKLKLTAEGGPASGEFTIVGRGSGEPSLRRVARFPIAGANATHTQAWLTATGK